MCCPSLGPKSSVEDNYDSRTILVVFSCSPSCILRALLSELSTFCYPLWKECINSRNRQHPAFLYVCESGVPFIYHECRLIPCSNHWVYTVLGVHPVCQGFILGRKECITGHNMQSCTVHFFERERNIIFGPRKIIFGWSCGVSIDMKRRKVKMIYWQYFPKLFALTWSVQVN